jgi:glycosyltransferase involved in cell wall biosynthesis
MNPNYMKILVFTTLYPNNVWPNQGVFIKERMAQFAKLDGCEVKVVAPVPYFPAVKLNWRWQFSQVVAWEVRDGIEVYHPRYFMLAKIGMVLYGWMMFLSMLPTIRRVQRDFDFDLIDAHFVYPDGFAAVLLGWFFKKPVVVSARGSDINVYSKFPVIRQFLKYTLKNASKVIAVSQALKESIAKLGVPDDRIKVIANGVDLNKFHPIAKRAARQSLMIPVHKKMILSVGHLTPNKGFDLIIRATKILVEEYKEKDIFLLIVGNGVAKTELETLVASLHLERYVNFAGGIPHEELYRWYSAADVFCLASAQEGWPNVLMESLACGTPVIATPVGGIPEIICSEEIGRLVQREDVQIANAIRDALHKQWRTDAIVQYVTEHAWSGKAKNVREVFEAILFSKEAVSRGCESSSEAVPTSR